MSARAWVPVGTSMVEVNPNHAGRFQQILRMIGRPFVDGEFEEFQSLPQSEWSDFVKRCERRCKKATTNK